jgi:glutathione S-transferase
MRTLYHTILSPFCRKIRLILKEKKLDFDLEIKKTWERRPQFLTLNPSGEVPVLVEINGTVIAHHQAICEYLEEAYPESTLLGDSLANRAEVRRLVGWFDELLYQEVSGPLIFEKVEKRLLGLGGPDSTVLRRAYHLIHRHLDYIGVLADHRNWLGGHSFSLADIAAAAHFSSLDYLGDVPWDKHEKAKDWYARVKSRPIFRTLLEDYMPGISPATTYKNLDF